MIDLTDIKATIRDNELLGAITPEQLQTYIEEEGFQLKDVFKYDGENVGHVFTNTNQEQASSVVVLDDPACEIYTITMASNLMNLEMFTEKSQIQIYLDITGNNLCMLSKATVEAIDLEMTSVVDSL